MSTKLNKRQQIAAEMLGLGHRPSAVAAKLSVSRETVSRWQQNSNFKQLSQQSHLELLANLLSERLLLIDKCHNIVAEAFENDDMSVTAKSSLAVRYLALTGAQSNVYGGIEQRQEFLLSKVENSNETFRWIMDVLDTLRSLKTANSNLSDAEYRRLAENIVRGNEQEN